MVDKVSNGNALRKRVGSTISEIRKEKGLSQTELGDSGNLSRLENGKQWVSEEQLVRLSQELGVPVWVIFARAQGAIGGELYHIVQAYVEGDADDRLLLRHAALSIRKRKNKE